MDTQEARGQIAGKSEAEHELEVRGTRGSE